jgi:MarR family transcriptional regulator, organic hydroperoxide resistance regulator
VPSRKSAIQAEIRQRKPFSSRSKEALVALLRTVDVLKRQVSQVVEPHDLTLQQYNVLRILRGARGEDLPTLEIAQRMIEQAPGITRLLDRLEAKGLVHRARCVHDRRQVLCGITPKGLKLLAALEEPMDRADAAALGMLGERDLDTLITLLDRIRQIHH